MLKKMGLFSRRALAESLLAPRIPVDRVMLVLQQVGRLLAGEAIGMARWIFFA